MFSFVDQTMIGRNTRPTPPWARSSQAASSWKVEPFGVSSEYAGSRVSPAPRAIAPVLRRGSPLARSAAARGRCGEVRVVPLHRQPRERPVRVHVLDDLAHRLDEALVVDRIVLVERDRQR